MNKHGMLVAASSISLALCGCAIHSTAKDWNGLYGSDGSTRYYRTTTKVGLNLLVGIPLVGDTSVDGMVDDLTTSIKNEDGDRVRIVQGSSENYWYGFPPLTWVLTPVIHTVAAEYSPSKPNYLADQRRIQQDEKAGSFPNPMKW